MENNRHTCTGYVFIKSVKENEKSGRPYYSMYIQENAMIPIYENYFVLCESELFLMLLHEISFIPYSCSYV